MPWYTSLPSDWQTELEKSIGARIIIEVIYDPDNENVILNSKYSIAQMSPIVTQRQLDIMFGRRPIMQNVSITFHDPDGYFNPDNSASPFHNCFGELDRDHAAGSTSIKLLDKADVEFAENERLTINDGTNSEIITVNTWTVASGSTYYHEIICSGLTHRYNKSTRIFTRPVENKDVLIRLRSPNCVSHIYVFRGKILKPPECKAGKATLVLIEGKKLLLDQYLQGADMDDDTKLMRINTDGELESSIVWS